MHRDKYYCAECDWAAKGPCPAHGGSPRSPKWRPGRKGSRVRLWDARIASRKAARKAMEIPLRRKYTQVSNGRYKSGYGGNSNPAKHHRTLTPAEKELHAKQPKKIMVMLPSGKTRMMVG